MEMTDAQFRRYAWRCRIESWLFRIPCWLFGGWFFRSVGGLRERIGTRCVQGYYGAGRLWDEYATRGFELGPLECDFCGRIENPPFIAGEQCPLCGMGFLGVPKESADA